MDGDHEVERGHDRREAVDEDGQRGSEDIAVGIAGGQRRIERPACIGSAHDQRVEDHQPRQVEDVPARQVDAREGEVPRADHHRYEEIAESGGNRRDQEEPDHDDPVHREHAVVDRGLQQPARRGEVQAHERRCEASDEKEEGDRGEEQQGDALVVLGQQPGGNACSRRSGSSARTRRVLRPAGTRSTVDTLICRSPAHCRGT